MSTGIETIDDLVERLRSTAATRRRSVEAVEHRPYAIRIYLRGPGVSHQIDLFYRSNHEVTSVHPVGGTLEEADREACLVWIREAIQDWNANNRLARLADDQRERVSEVLLTASKLFESTPVFLGAGDYSVRFEVNGVIVNVFNNKEGQWTTAKIDHASPSADNITEAASVLMKALTD